MKAEGETIMKNILFLALASLVLAVSGCGSMAMHPRTYGVAPVLFTGGYGSTGGYATGMGPGGTGTGGAPLIAPSYAAAPVVRGYGSPYGGTDLSGTGYVNPEAVRASDAARDSWRYAAVPLTDPSAPLPTYAPPSPCASGDCGTASSDPRLDEIEERLDEHDEQILTDHAAIVTATTH